MPRLLGTRSPASTKASHLQASPSPRTPRTARTHSPSPTSPQRSGSLGPGLQQALQRFSGPEAGRGAPAPLTCRRGAWSSSFHQSRSSFCCWNSSSQLTTCTTVQPSIPAAGAAACREVGGRSPQGLGMPGLREARGGEPAPTGPGGPSSSVCCPASCSSASTESASSVTAEGTQALRLAGGGGSPPSPRTHRPSRPTHTAV